MSHGWNYAYWAMAKDGCDSILLGNQTKWDACGSISRNWLRSVAKRVEFFP